MSDLFVRRYGKYSALDWRGTGDFIGVTGASVRRIELGETRRLVDLEFARAKIENPANPASAMRPMFYTGSPFGAELRALAAKEGRP